MGPWSQTIAIRYTTGPLALSDKSLKNDLSKILLAKQTLRQNLSLNET